MFKFPYTNLHELNLDWILEKVKHFAELIPPMETAVDDVQALTDDVAQAVEDAGQALEDAGEALETAEEAKEIAEQAAQGTIADGAVVTSKIADYAVTTIKINDGAITNPKLAVNAVEENNIADSSVTTDKINDGAITLSKLDNTIKQSINRLIGKTIAIYGDSWATSTYGSLGASYIEQTTGTTVHVRGFSSQTLAGIYTNGWDSFIADIYIIEGGLNDASLGTGATTFTSAVNTWISSIKIVNPDAEIYFITPPAIKEANQSTIYKFPLEFYRIGLWSLAPFKGFAIINGLKWSDVVLGNDNVHPLPTESTKIGKHIVNALCNYGDEESHTTEVSYLGRNDTYFRIDCIGGTIYLVSFNFNGVATSNHLCEVSLGTLDTVFSTASIAFINQKTGGAGDITYKSNAPNNLTYYCYGSLAGTEFITLVIKMPVEVSDWVNPYI